MPRAIPEFRQLLTGLADEVGSTIERLGAGVGRLDRSELLAYITDAYPELITPYISASADITATWYEDQPTRAGAALFYATPAELPSVEQLAASGRWAMGESDPTKALQGTAKRSIFRSSRNTVVVNARAEQVRWVRHARPGACGFCRMLATRSATVGNSSYLTEGTARAASKSHIAQGHDFCTCLIIPDRDSAYELPDYTHQWAADYETARNEGASTLAQIAQAMERIGNEREAAAAARVSQRRQQADIATWLDAEDEHLASIAYWRRVDAEDLHTAPAAPAGAASAEAGGAALAPMDRAVAELEDALAAGDDDRIEAAAIALEQLEDAERQAAERKARNRERARERRAAQSSAQSEQIVALIDAGTDPAEAEAEVTGKSVESIRRRDFVRMARAEGLRGGNFEQLLSSAFHRQVSELAIEAENATNGYMLRARFDGKVNAKDLWYVSDKKARELMSDEMAAWLDENGGRITRQILKQMVLSGRYGLRRYTATGEDFLQ
ncbi:VG15 protein [Mycobacteroides chelonae]|uniref:VG15 protein n=1 Tax=Mycobacteroides chelonae TaxID=1774 RepID=UPI0038762A54